MAGYTIIHTNNGLVAILAPAKDSLVGSVVTVGDGLLVDAGGTVTAIGTNLAGLTP